MANANAPLRVEIDVASLRERTTDTLRNAILSFHFAPGERLVERRLCEETGVSRTCIREALQHLEAEGLVRRAPNRGLFVAEVTADEARQIYEVRAALESEMVRLFVQRATPGHVRALEEAVRRVQRGASGADMVVYATALTDLTDAIADGAGNDLASQILNTLKARMTYLRVVTTKVESEARRRKTMEMLTELVAAMLAGEAEAAEAMSRAYVSRSATFAMDVLRDREANRSPSQSSHA